MSILHFFILVVAVMTVLVELFGAILTLELMALARHGEHGESEQHQ